MVERRTLTVAEVAQALGIGETLVRKSIASGDIRATRLGRRLLIAREEVDRVLSDGSRRRRAG